MYHLMEVMIVNQRQDFYLKVVIQKIHTFNYPYSIGSLEKLEKSVKGLGSISFLDQTDGIIRSLTFNCSF